MKPTIRASDDLPGVAIMDPIQGRRFQLATSGPVHPRPVDAEEFSHPVESASEIITDHLVLPYVVAVYVRTEAGNLVREIQHNAHERLPDRAYLVELMAPIKLYVRVSSTLAVTSSTDQMRFDFGNETTVQIGVRSIHRRPAATVTTTAAPCDLMAAISTFGSALKTTSCERSLPSLRGHPPQLKLGDELHISEDISPPDTGVRIELPPDRGLIYAVSTLAYYLGATVVPGDEPRFVVDDRVVHSFDQPQRAFEDDVERILKQVFLLDCITRTEGYYPVELHERRQLEERVDISWTDLYDASLADQLEAYLDVSFNAIEDLLPTWRLASYATRAPDTAELLPFAVNELSLIRTTASTLEPTQSSTPPIDVETFARVSEDARDDSAAVQSWTYVTPRRTDTLERAWLAEGKPLRANKLMNAAFENKFDRERSADDIDITIVCNDAAMSEEYTSGTLYGNRDALPFDVTVHRDIPVEELQAVLQADTDFLHYIGHVEGNGFVCQDGALDPDEVEQVGVETFLLNGCQSYKQGLQLIDAGSVGGIVTYSDVGNDSATEVGQLVARLLNSGFSLRAALAIARDHRIVGSQYVVVGDGGVQIAQNEAGMPIVCRIEPCEVGEQYNLQVTTYPTAGEGMGAMYMPHLDAVHRHFLAGGSLPTFTVTASELVHFLSLDLMPVILDDELYWSNDEKLYGFYF